MKQEKKISDMVENRITEHQLTKIRSFEESFAKGREMIGGLTVQYEFQKSSILAQFAELEKDYSKLKSDLKEQYGDVDIDLGTGIYTVKEEKEE
jgi:hypothetical protein